MIAAQKISAIDMTITIWRQIEKKYQKIAIFRQIYVFLGFITLPYPICVVL